MENSVQREKAGGTPPTKNEYIEETLCEDCGSVLRRVLRAPRPGERFVEGEATWEENRRRFPHHPHLWDCSVLQGPARSCCRGEY